MTLTPDQVLGAFGAACVSAWGVGFVLGYFGRLLSKVLAR